MMQPADIRQALLQDNGKPRVIPVEDLHAIFIRTVAHELRTPLSILLGYAELLDSQELGDLEPQQKYATDIIVARTHELRLLVERIGVLLAARAHATVSVPLALHDIVSKVVENRRADATDAGLTLETSVEPALPLVTGDPWTACSRTLSNSRPAAGALRSESLQSQARSVWSLPTAALV
jgi:signal transduction histidine kinase